MQLCEMEKPLANELGEITFSGSARRQRYEGKRKAHGVRTYLRV